MQAGNDFDPVAEGFAGAGMVRGLPSVGQHPDDFQLAKMLHGAGRYQQCGMFFARLFQPAKISGFRPSTAGSAILISCEYIRASISGMISSIVALKV